MKRIEAVVAAMTHQKAFSPEMLGHGKSNGGSKVNQRHRFEVLERVRRVGNLTSAQNGQWEYFKTKWDAARALEEGTPNGVEYSLRILRRSLKT